MTLTNTIIANSRAQNCGGSVGVASGGHNLSSDATCFSGGGTDLLDTPRQLEPLRNNGGATQTIALKGTRVKTA